MSVLIIGCGSIGRRHAQNSAGLTDITVFDVDSAQAQSVCEELSCKVFTSLDEALNSNPDRVVIAVPNAYHFETAKLVLEHTDAKILLEKPICTNLQDAKSLVELSKDRLFVVTNMRFHQAITCLKDNLTAIGQPLFARAHFGNYLPNMRPGVDYRHLYVAQKDGGGVTMDCIHELDYLLHIFGPALDVSARLKTLSDLEIEAEDYAAITLSHESGARSEIHLDFLQQNKRRGCEIVGTKGTLLWSSTGKNPEHCIIKLFEADTQNWKTLLDTTELDGNLCYEIMMKAFIDGEYDLLADAQEGIKALACVFGAYQSNETGSVVSMKDIL